MERVKKLSTKVVYGDISVKDLVVAPGNKIHCARFGGRAVGEKKGTKVLPDGTVSNWVGLVGDFVGFSGKDGAEFRAPVLFLPDVALVPIQVQMAAPGAVSCDFMVDIFAVLNENPQGSKYVFTWAPVVESKGDDPIGGLLAQAKPLMIQGKPVGGLMLEAPAPAPASVPAPAPAPAPAAPKSSKAK